MNVNYEAAQALKMMKYALNHPWKFKHPYVAFMSGFFQAISTAFTALVCYSIILSSVDILELAKDFTALTIIINFDNYFALTSSDDITKEIVEGIRNKSGIYEGLLKNETTTSADARGSGNAVLEPLIDPANALINKRTEQQNKHSARKNSCCGRKKPVKRPKTIAITWRKRCNLFGCRNVSLFMVYRLFRGLFVSLLFYYLPVIFVVLSNLIPVKIYWDKIEGCDQYVEQDCVGAGGKSAECAELCIAFNIQTLNNTLTMLGK